MMAEILKLVAATGLVAVDVAEASLSQCHQLQQLHFCLREVWLLGTCFGALAGKADVILKLEADIL